MTTIIIGIISPIFSLLAVFTSFFLGKWSKNRDYKRSILEKRYYEFYIPFFYSLARDGYPRNSLYRLEAIHQNKYVDLISKNIQYLDVVTASFFKTFYFNYLRSLEFSTGNYPQNEQFVIENEEIFKQIVSQCQKESKSIAAKLKLEPVTEVLL